MKNVVLAVVVSTLAMIVGYAGLLGYKTAHDMEGDKVAASALEKLREVKRLNGAYPAKFNPARSDVWGIFPGPDVKYHFDGQDCDIYYLQWPLGPHHVLDCRTNEWRFEE